MRHCDTLAEKEVLIPDFVVIAIIIIPILRDFAMGYGYKAGLSAIRLRARGIDISRYKVEDKPDNESSSDNSSSVSSNNSSRCNSVSRSNSGADNKKKKIDIFSNTFPVRGDSDGFFSAPISKGQIDLIHLWRPVRLYEDQDGETQMETVEVEQPRKLISKEEEENQKKPGPKKDSKRLQIALTRGFEFTADPPGDSDWMYCEGCDRLMEGPCQAHLCPILVDVPILRNGSLSNRARATTPYPLCVRLSRMPGAGYGVYSSLDLPAGLVLGPYEGRTLERVPEEGRSSGYSWSVRIPDEEPIVVDALDTSVSNWMRYVNCSRHELETNLAVFQVKGEIYFRSLRMVSKGMELKVWYGDEFGELFYDADLPKKYVLEDERYL